MLWSADLGWMTPQTCLLGHLQCSSLATGEHCCCRWRECKRTERGSWEDSSTRKLVTDAEQASVFHVGQNKCFWPHLCPWPEGSDCARALSSDEGHVVGAGPATALAQTFGSEASSLAASCYSCLKGSAALSVLTIATQQDR